MALVVDDAVFSPALLILRAQIFFRVGHELLGRHCCHFGCVTELVEATTENFDDLCVWHVDGELVTEFVEDILQAGKRGGDVILCQTG